jgi:hypothetical protein
MQRELFQLPPIGEGAGAYVDEIIESLTVWTYEPNHSVQEYEFLVGLHNFLNKYFDREREDLA